MPSVDRIFTRAVTNEEFTIMAAGGAMRMSVVCQAGSIQVTGDLTFQDVESSALTFDAGDGITITSSSAFNPLDGITINAPTADDVAYLVIQQSL